MFKRGRSLLCCEQRCIFSHIDTYCDTLYSMQRYYLESEKTCSTVTLIVIFSSFPMTSKSRAWGNVVRCEEYGLPAPSVVVSGN